MRADIDAATASGLYDRSYFFDKGIRFACLQCGACCTGNSGIVYIDSDQINLIARHLNLTPTELIATRLTAFQAGFTARENSHGACVFYHNGCSIYPVRPLQCRSFPFWFNLLRSEKSWQTVRDHCPGIGRGRRYDKSWILEHAHQFHGHLND